MDPTTTATRTPSRPTSRAWFLRPPCSAHYSGITSRSTRHPKVSSASRSRIHPTRPTAPSLTPTTPTPASRVKPLRSCKARASRPSRPTTTASSRSAPRDARAAGRQWLACVRPRPVQPAPPSKRPSGRPGARFLRPTIPSWPPASTPPSRQTRTARSSRSARTSGSSIRPPTSSG